MKSRIPAFPRLAILNPLQTDRWTVQILCFCASFALISVVLEEINLRLGFWWVWILAIFCWRSSRRWARNFVRAGDKAARESTEDHPVIDVSRSSRFSADRPLEWLGLTVSFFIWCLAIYHLLFYFYELNGNWVIRNGNLNGDWPFHLNMIRYLERLNQFWPGNPVFFEDHLRYSFGINWITALFARGGLSINLIVGVSAIVFVTLAFIELYKWFGVCGVLAFFVSGGGWGMPLFQQIHLWEPGSTLAWKNLFLAVFVPQRGMWFALPCGVFLLRYLFEHIRTPEGLPQKQKKTWAFLWAVLPFFHLHTFFIVTILVGVLWLYKATPPILFYLIRRAPIPAFFLFKSVGAGNLKSSLRTEWSWMSSTEPVWQSWLVNFGPWLLIPLILLAFQSRIFAKELYLKKVFFAALALFVIFSHVMVAPWAWDQIKVILWLYLILSAIAVLVFESAIHRLAVWVMMAAVFSPGIAQFSGGHPAGLRPETLWSVEDQDTVNLLVADLPIWERVVTAPDPHHPIFSTGQPIVAGYEGHLWSHGLNVANLNDSVKSFILKKPVIEQWRTLNAKYLLWGAQEKQWMGLEQVPDDAGWIKLKTVGQRSLYFRDSNGL